MARNLDRSIDLVRARVFRGVYCSTLLSWLGLGLFGVGCVALILRATLELGSGPTLLVLAPVALLPLLAWRSARQRSLSRAGAAAWLDSRTGATGEVVTSFETGDGPWAAQVDRSLARLLELPRARLRRPAALAMAGAAFGALAILVPIPRTLIGPSAALQAAGVASVEEKLATLEEVVTLEPEVAAELHEALDRMEDERALADPESAFEAADRATDRLELEAEARAEVAASALQGLASAAADSESNPAGAQEDIEQVLSALAKSGLGKGLSPSMQRELGLSSLELPAGTRLDQAQIQALTGELAGKLGEKLSKLAQAGLLKPGTFQGLGKPGELREFKDHVCTEECARNPGGT